VCRTHAVPIVLLALVSAFQQMDGYVAGTYAISFMRSSGIALSTVAILLFIARIGDMVGVLVSGLIADLSKRRWTAAAAILVTTTLSYPLVFAILDRRIVLLAAVQFFIALFGIGVMHGLAPILSSESFPTKYRYSGSGIAYNLSAMLGGMIAPSLLAGLIGQDVTHKWFYIPLVYVVYCAAALVALVFLRETRDLALDELDAEDVSPSRASITPAVDLSSS
jgi:MFS family permease